YNQSKGQLNHYFNKVSNNKFHLIPAVETHANNTNQDGIITVTLPGNHPNPQGDGDFVQKLVDALTIADSYIDFSTYDVSDDGILNKSDLQIMFLVAGYETSATGSPDPSVWAHKWCVFGQEGGVNPPTLDGVSILSCLNDGNGYSRFGERQFADGHDATIGIIAHELGHAIWGLPDLYDTDGSSSGIGNFGLMGGGSWGYVEGESPGATPVHPTAWTKIETGWFSPDDTAGAKTMYRTEDNLYNIVKVDITTDTSEYFLIENRGAAGYDLGLFMLTDIPSGTPFQGGIAIWHIDASQDTNSNEARKLVDLEEAANPGLDDDIDRGKSTNLFWDTNNATFDDNSTPDSKDYSATASGVSITNISDRKADMTLIVN
ncbi:M6 family metalloprotease domain-containing protein, partial [bacterium]|nr:M6 family metalloprotease domain-containing protein [bacterium]